MDYSLKEPMGTRKACIIKYISWGLSYVIHCIHAGSIKQTAQVGSTILLINGVSLLKNCF